MRDRVRVVLATVLLMAATATSALGQDSEGGIPPWLLGDFADDYGIRYTIRTDAWIQRPDASYRIERWDVDARHLIARDPAGAADGGDLWLRVDWVRLGTGAEFTWAFCYAVYDAASLVEARDGPSSNRATPREGCNGYPFSRMRREGEVADADGGLAR